MKHTDLTRKKSPSYTPLTEDMIKECPAVDIHVHMQGTITPQTAWELGIRNHLVSIHKDKDGMWHYKGGSHSISKDDPVGNYSNVFRSKGGNELSLDKNGNPVDLEYNFYCKPGQRNMFEGFDALMATVQGHRNPPGGIQTESDYRLVMDRYLDSCKEQKIAYTEVLQNIYIAQVIYKTLQSPEEARAKFFKLCSDIQRKFDEAGVELRFHNCPNKTSQSGRPGTLEEQSLDWVKWLEESKKTAPGVFVGLNSAGSEKYEKHEGGPWAMTRAYTQAAEAGFGCEAHAGEGIGVEHMMATMKALPVTRLAHGVQVIESQQAIDEVRRKNITLIMMPCINVALHSPIHTLGGKPHAKFHPDGKRNPNVKTEHIRDLASHPFFPLLRKHKLPIALAGDDPEMGGEPYKIQVRKLAGLGDYKFPDGFKPLSAEELTLCNLSAINAAFCSDEVKKNLVKELARWMKKNNIHVSHPLLEQFKEHSPRQQDGRPAGFSGL